MGSIAVGERDQEQFVTLLCLAILDRGRVLGGWHHQVVDRCPQCEFDYTAVNRSEVPSRLGSIGTEFRTALDAVETEEMLRRRPRPEVWSALEYACHVRDVLLAQRERLYVALVEDRPSFTRMYRDERVELARYNFQDRELVASQLVVAAQLAAQAFGDLGDDDWDCHFIYNWPDAQERDMAWLAAHTIHEGRHHLADFHAVATGRVPGEV